MTRKINTLSLMQKQDVLYTDADKCLFHMVSRPQGMNIHVVIFWLFIGREVLFFFFFFFFWIGIGSKLLLSS